MHAYVLQRNFMPRRASETKYVYKESLPSSEKFIPPRSISHPHTTFISVNLHVHFLFFVFFLPLFNYYSLFRALLMRSRNDIQSPEET